MMAFFERTATSILEGLGTRLWGFAPRLMATIVGELGPLQALGWFLRNMPRYERTLAAFGGVRTHLVCFYISLLRGCPYCTLGHARAFELLFLKERGELFPLDEEAILALQRLDAGAIRQRLGEALTKASLPDELGLLDRAKAVMDGRVADLRGDDARLDHLVKMFAVLNSCGIKGAVVPDEAHDPINKDVALKQRYAALRAGASKSRVATQGAP
jgi:hypothetical protein